jgi:hypothetical protein
MIRISGSENIKIRSSSNLKFAFPDPYTVQFVLNEGAFVIEGVEQSADLINKYYPSFLFALNQKYLFNYMQGKINELPLIKKDHLIKYNAKDLKVLQQTMINAEFCQIFTSLSNYNEIDMFFENLREKFKINELKLEYMASIEGISRITQIKEKEEDDQHRKIEEQKTDENNKRLNNILLILTIAQVWSGLVDIFEYKDEDCWKLYLNLVVYLIFLVFIVSNIKNKSIKK